MQKVRIYPVGKNEIYVSLSWVYVNGVRVTTDGFNGFRNWLIINDIPVTIFSNWPFDEGLSFSLNRVRKHA